MARVWRLSLQFFGFEVARGGEVLTVMASLEMPEENVKYNVLHMTKFRSDLVWKG